MSLKYDVRQTRDVTILDLNGRLSLGEALICNDLSTRGNGFLLLSFLS